MYCDGVMHARDTVKWDWQAKLVHALINSCYQCITDAIILKHKQLAMFELCKRVTDAWEANKISIMYMSVFHIHKSK